MIWALDLDDFSNRCHHTLEKNARKIYMVREKYELHKSGEGHHFIKIFTTFIRMASLIVINRCGCENYPLLRTINRVLRAYPSPDPQCDGPSHFRGLSKVSICSLKL